MKIRCWLLLGLVLAELGLSRISSQAVPVTQAAGGYQHTLFLKSDGSLWAMGANSINGFNWGQLGNGTYTTTNSPQLIVAAGVTALAAGGHHSLFIKSDGSLWGMGDNEFGQLGDGTYANHNLPVPIVTTGVTAVAAGFETSYFIKDDGSLWTMGRNQWGQLGNGTYILQTNRPEKIVGSDVTTVAAGADFAYFLQTGGSLWAMGHNNARQLGVNFFDQEANNILPFYYRTNLPILVVGGGVKAIAAGVAHGLFIASNGSLWGMGSNLNGQLGAGIYGGFNTNQPQQIVSSNVTAIAAGDNHSLFLKSNGSLWSMGNNAYGQLGDGSYSYVGDGSSNKSGQPEKVVSSGVTAISSGGIHSLFISANGSLWGMGNNGEGELGDGTYNWTNLPELMVADVPVIVGQPAPQTTTVAGSPVYLSVGAVSDVDPMTFQWYLNGSIVKGATATTLTLASVALGDSGNYQVIVSNPNGSVASGLAGLRVTNNLTTAESVNRIAAGPYFSLFCKSDGTLWAMGKNSNGQLGDGSYNQSLNPEQIVGIKNVAAIAAGGNHALLLASDGSLWAMGLNNHGQLGDGTYSSFPLFSTNLPERILAGGVTAIAAGGLHSLFLKQDGSLWAMGDDEFGQLGDGAPSYDRPQPGQIVASGVIAIGAGDRSSQFVKSDGSLWVMDNTYNNNHLPKQLVPGGVTAVAGASLFLKSDGSLWMSQGYSGVPLQIATGGVIAMAQGPGHLLFIKIDGSLWGMGNNGSGQLGDGTFNRANQPQMIVSGGVTAVAAGALHSLFRKNDGSLWAMGSNDYGQLGDGTSLATNRPKKIVSVAAAPAQLSRVSRAGASLVLYGVYGSVGGHYHLLVSSDVTRPVNQWSPVATNVLNDSGTFTFALTNALMGHFPEQFYRLEVP